MKMFESKGFRVLHIPTNGPSDIVNARIVVNVGAAYEPPDSYGAAHFLEHMFYKGTPKWNWRDLNLLTSKLGNANAYTSHMRTAFYLSFRRKDLALAIEVLTDILFNATLCEEEFTKERDVIIEEFHAGQADPLIFFFGQLYTDTFGENYGHPVIGNEDSLKAMTTDKLRNIWQYYNPSNLIISVAGNVEEDEVKDVLERYLPEKEPVVATGNAPEFNWENYDFNHISKQAVIAFTVRGITGREEIERNFVADIFCNGLAGRQHSLLYNRMREELGLCYQIDSYHTANELYGVTILFCLLDEKNVEQATEEINAMIDKIVEEGFSDELLETCKANYLFQFGCRLETSRGTNQIADSFFSIGDYPFAKLIDPEERSRAIDSLTNDHITEYANEFFGKHIPRKILRMTEQK